jgi:hypothetical protein
MAVALRSEKGQDVETRIRELARAHGIALEQTQLDKWVRHVSWVSNNEDVTLDEVEQLIVQLGRANILSSLQATMLHVEYLNFRNS